MQGISDRVAALVLAAGGGTRLGGGKLLLPWKGRPLLAHTLQALIDSGVTSSIIVVLGHEAETVRGAIGREFPDHGIAIVTNDAWQEGQSTSLRTGMAALPAVDSVLIALGDQPTLLPETVRLLVEHHVQTKPSATAPTYQGRRGNPVILSQSLFDAAREVQGDKGARGILADLGEKLLLVPVDDPGVVRDIDTPEAYASLG